MALDMVAAATDANVEILAPGTDISTQEAVTNVVDVAMLPKAIGGSAVSIDEEGKEDERCCLGGGRKTIAEALKGIVMEG